jgi:hypothetical protein
MSEFNTYKKQWVRLVPYPVLYEKALLIKLIY